MKKNLLLKYLIYKFIFIVSFSMLCYSTLKLIGYEVSELQLYVIPVIVTFLYDLIEYFITRTKNRLAIKISRCNMRKKNGNSYCADCPDGYTCANIK